ncbi:MAG: murein biosynthesis integral membrane protein MurJ [Chloroflexi bacterium]|nr:murein biosynthesis integral membrane protein MurJ [Chloroflexota bacterium]
MKLFRASALLALLFGIDKLIGLGRQVLINQRYGLTRALDAYNVANNLPDTVVAMLSGGALAIAIIPLLAETLGHEGRAAMWGLFSRVTNLIFATAAVLALALAIFAMPLVQHIVVPGYDLDRQILVASLMRLDLIAMLIFCISGLVMGGLQAQQHFLLPGLAPILYNVGQIGGVLLLSGRFGIYGLAYGVIGGAVLHLGIQIPGLIHYGFQWSPSLQWRHPGLLRVFRLMGPRIVNIAIVQLIFILTDRFASFIPGEGVASALTLGWTIMQLPQTVIGTAAATALLPSLAELISRGDDHALRTTLQTAIKVVLALTLLATIISLAFVRPAVELVFEGRGKFTAENTALLIPAAQMFLLGIAGHSLVEIAVRTFYARQRPWTPLIAAALTAVVFVGLCFALTPLMGHAGIALANTLAFTAEALGLLWLLRRQNVL